MKKSLILSALASSILLGCGGGGGGSSSSTPAPAKKFTFQFVNLEERNIQADSKCTVFDVDGQQAGKETIAILAKKVKVTIQNADGSFASDLSDSINDAGILTFTVDDIADGGYVSVIDSPSDTDHYYKVLSIQKELLSDLVISVDRNQPGTTCYEKNKLPAIKTGYASVDINGIPASTFAYDSSQKAITPVAYTSRDMTAFNQEDILVRGYQNTDLVDYVFVSSLTELEDANAVDLNGLPLSTFNWSVGLSANELQTLSIRINKGDFSYPWVDAGFVTATNVTTDFPYSVNEASWGYTAKGLSENWSFTRTDVLGDNLDVKLPDEIQLTNQAPTVTANGGSSFTFESAGFSSNLDRVQRSNYQKVFDSSNTLNHVIYSQLSDGEDVLIPQLNLANLDASSATNLKVGILSADNISTDLATYFMHENAENDLVSVIALPSKTAERNKLRDTSSYTLLSR